MIQDISPKKLNNSFGCRTLPAENSPVICFDGNKILIKVCNGEMEFIKAGDLESNTGDFCPEENEKKSNGVESCSGMASLTFLFSVDEEAFFLVKKENLVLKGQKEPAEESELKRLGFEFIDLKELREMKLGPWYRNLVIYTAKHLYDWYRASQFCGRCGHSMLHSETERAMTCPACRNTVYPRINPAVIVGVTNGDEILLTRYRRGYGHNALIAGFIEIGETVEEAVAREVMEESGLKVKNIRYYKSQPWGSASDLLMGFYCDVDGNDEIHLDEGELRYGAWVPREEIELQPDSYSLTNEMMKMFKEGKNS